jgi:hypothetical protein
LRDEAAQRTADNVGWGVTRTIETLLRDLAALLKRSAALKMHAHELFKTADQLRHKADGIKDAPSEKSEAEGKQ